MLTPIRSDTSSVSAMRKNFWNHARSDFSHRQILKHKLYQTTILQKEKTCCTFIMFFSFIPMAHLLAALMSSISTLGWSNFFMFRAPEDRERAYSMCAVALLFCFIVFRLLMWCAFAFLVEEDSAHSLSIFMTGLSVGAYFWRSKFWFSLHIQFDHPLTRAKPNKIPSTNSSDL